MFWLFGALALWWLARTDTKSTSVTPRATSLHYTPHAPSAGGKAVASPLARILSSAQRPSANLATKQATATAAAPASTAGTRTPATPAPSAPAPSAPTPTPDAPAPAPAPVFVPPTTVAPPDRSSRGNA